MISIDPLSSGLLGILVYEFYRLSAQLRKVQARINKMEVRLDDYILQQHD